MRIDPSRAIGACAAVMTVAALWLGLGGAMSERARFTEIDVERINVREADGTLRLAISNRARIPGIILGGKEYPHPNRREAGMIFYNDDGDENGGLVFSGGLVDGKPTNAGHLSFDRWRQDQTLFLDASEDGARQRAGLTVQDRPDRPMDMAAVVKARALPDGPAKDAAYTAAGLGSSPRRVFLGRDYDGSSQLALRDAAGRERLVLRVAADGAARIDFLDAAGKVVRSEAPAPRP